MWGCAMASDPVQPQQPIRFGEGYELDLRPRRLRRGSQVLKLERIPLEILLLLLEHRDEIVTRDQIVSRVWGQGVFLDTDNSIRGAIRKLRQVLKDDAETPRFIQTVTGQGYRFIGLVVTPKQASAASEPAASVVPTSDRNFVSELDGWLQARRLRVVERYEVARRRGRRLLEPLMDMEIGRNTTGFLLEQWLCSQSRAFWRFGAGDEHRARPHIPRA